jgi:uncharacterized delta-60 repeat protein
VFAAGEVDPTFNPPLIKDVVSDFNANTALQPDGKIIIYGYFFSGATPTGRFLYRLNPDGTPDTSFSCAVCGAFSFYSVAVQPDGKIILAGNTSPSSYFAKIVRVNPDGSLDNSFSATFNPPPSGFSSGAEVLLTQPDGKVLIRYTTSGFGFTGHETYRLNSDGSRDQSFATINWGPFRMHFITYSKVFLLPDGKILISGTQSASSQSEGFLMRYNSDGTVDSSFGQPIFADPENRSYVNGFAVQPDGSIVVSGKFTGINSVDKTDLARLFPAGNVDLNFTADSLFNPIETYSGSVAILPNGQILINTVNFSSVFPVSTDNKILRFNSNGSLDNTYNQPIGLTFIYSWMLDASSRAVILGTYSGTKRFLRLNTDATLDPNFNPPLVKAGTVSAAAVQPDGKILLGGDFTRVGATARNTFARVNSNGTLDPSFDPGSGFNVAPSFIALQPDGKILTIGTFTSYNGTSRFGFARVNSDGSLDSSFDPDVSESGGEPVLAAALVADGKILIGGSFFGVDGVPQRTLARLNSNGGLDPSFSPIFGTGARVRAILVQTDGKIMVGGSFSGVNGFSRQNLVRLNSDGSLDESFNAGTISEVYKVARQTDGKYLTTHSVSLSRKNIDGSVDASFQGSTNGFVYSVVPQPDGTIVIGGQFSIVSGSARGNFARLASNGVLDSLFIPEGANNAVNVIAPQSDGKLIVGGNFSTIGTVARNGAARVTPSVFRRVTPFDFDGDGMADVSVFRPSENKWYVLRSSDFGVTQQVFAIAGDVPVPADYDGDGKTDFAIFRPSSGDWWSLSSTNGAQVYAHWGVNGDIPRPSDFDGDGRADYIVFRPSNNFWYRISSGAGGAVSNSAFGLTGDKAVTGDFDGDGKSDKAIFRPSTGDWWYQSSINGAQLAVHWGISTDVPAPANFDGDGKTDFCVYRPSTGVWYIINSSTGAFTILNFGLAEDKPVPADYDGDGRADIAVFRPSSGAWYIMRTTAGMWGAYWGVSTDIPIESAFVP